MADEIVWEADGRAHRRPTLPISPTFDPPHPPDYRLLAAAAERLEASICRQRDIAAVIGMEHALAAKAMPIERVRRSFERLAYLTAGLAEEIGRASEAIGALRTIVGGGRP